MSSTLLMVLAIIPMASGFRRNSRIPRSLAFSSEICSLYPVHRIMGISGRIFMILLHQRHVQHLVPGIPQTVTCGPLYIGKRTRGNPGNKYAINAVIQQGPEYLVFFKLAQKLRMTVLLNRAVAGADCFPSHDFFFRFIGTPFYNVIHVYFIDVHSGLNARERFHCMLYMILV